jgi:hypothetical protein
MNALNIVFLHDRLYTWAVVGPKLWWVVGQVPIYINIYTHAKRVLARVVKTELRI